MDRRVFIGSLAVGMLAWPRLARGQPGGNVHRIGIVGLSPTTANMAGPDPQNKYANALLRGLRELGYVYGKHFMTEPRGAEGQFARFPALAADLIRLKADVIVGVAASVSALKRATSTIPIVMPGSDDPVGQGFVQSLAHPGGNVTGLSFQSVELIGKQLELLKEVAPTATPVAILWAQGHQKLWQVAEAAARERGWKLLSLEVGNADDLDRAFRTATAARAGALLVCGGQLLDPQFRRIADLAAKSRLPAMYRFRFQVDAGGLMSYGPDLVDIWRRAATFVDKILKGASPADLPVEQPTKFELVVSQKAATAIGLAIPRSVLLRADTIIS